MRLLPLLSMAVFAAPLPAQVAPGRSGPTVSWGAMVSSRAGRRMSQVPASSSTSVPPGASATAQLYHDRLAFAASSTAGGVDSAYFIGLDGAQGHLVSQVNVVQTDNVNSAAFTQDRQGLFVAGGLPPNDGVKFCDLSVYPPAWSTIYSAPPTGGGIYDTGPWDLALDEPRGLLYALESSGGLGNTALKAFDITSGSATYGQVIASSATMGSTTFVSRLGLSGDGALAVAIELITARAFVIDTDPLSATYMDILTTLQVPSPGGNPFATDVVINGDGTMALITLQFNGTTPSEVARLDLTTLSFIDHNPNMAGVQNIGQLSSPAAPLGSAAMSVQFSSDGAFGVVCGFGGPGFAGRLDFVPANPLAWSYVPYNVPAGLSDAWAVGLSSDDLVVGVETAGEVVFIEAMSGVQASVVPIASPLYVYTLCIQ